MMRGRKVRQARVLSLVAERYRLPRREHREGEFRESGQNTVESGIAEQDAMRQMSRTEPNGIEGLEE